MKFLTLPRTKQKKQNIIQLHNCHFLNSLKSSIAALATNFCKLLLLLLLVKP